ncbi:hypothetical protein H5410_026964 [Solanum commersonii]|uniref:Uncharacterized protein n=1 Tax=Solanum commersonii TaxID=4109 RepID=A0A9J5Z0E7_SOLCO|nr:hypothetical protein H5410_026964 [Solanum commersonii]
MSICHVSFPEPMILPKQVYFLYGNLLCLRQEEEDEAAHDEYQAREQQKNSIFEVTERHKEALCNERCEDHIDTDHHALSCRSCFQGK